MAYYDEIIEGRKSRAKKQKSVACFVMSRASLVAIFCGLVIALVNDTSNVINRLAIVGIIPAGVALIIGAVIWLDGDMSDY